MRQDYTIIAAPGFKCIPEMDHTRSEAAILVNYEDKLVVICGTQYAGEIKKSVFSVMNYVLPKEGVFPMHCSANIGHDGDSAVFFGLSGTGKTTLSADPNRKLIGDDEHGWADDSVFNFEGGCYAKCINLSPEERARDLQRHQVRRAWLKTWSWIPRPACSTSDDGISDREHPRGLSRGIHPQRRASPASSASVPRPLSS